MRHLLTTTTVNIAGSRVNSEVIIAGDRDTRIPHGFFFNDGVLEALLPSDLEVRRLIPFSGVSIAEQGKYNLDSKARRREINIL